jgi:toxin ParE1/3/4
MRLVWSDAAVDDLVGIRRYITEHNPSAANAIANRLLTIAELLIAQPEMGVATSNKELRRLVVPHSVYSLIYRIVDTDIEIIQVFDGRLQAPRSRPQNP